MDTKEKQEILQYLSNVSKQTSINNVLKDLNINRASFYACKYSLDKMQQVKTEMQKRIKKLK